MSCPLDALTELNLDDLMTSFGCDKQWLISQVLRRVFRGAATTFAAQMAAFDTAVGERAQLAGAAQALLGAYYIKALHVAGRGHIPAQGPALFLSNHPGMADTVSLCAAINRPDLKILAQRRPFLESLPNTARHMFFVDDNLGKRVILAHEVAAHLRAGGAVLTFPAGGIEPDPDVADGALLSLNDWTDSARLIARMAPQTKLVPVLVRGVIWDKAARHWLARLKRGRAAREKCAAALQLLAMVSHGTRPTAPHVRFAPPVSLADCGAPEAIHQAVIGRMRQMITSLPGLAAPATAAPFLWQKPPQPTVG